MNSFSCDVFVYRNDLAFDVTGYAFVLCNDIFTASYGVYMKKKINAKVNILQTISLLPGNV